MKKFMHLIVFFMAFQMEVRVRASGDFLEKPLGCLKTQESCSLRGGSDGFHLLKEDLKLHADSGSALVRLSPLHWRLVSGVVWVENGNGLQMETLYGSFRATQGQYWVIEKEGQIVVRNISAELQVTLRDGKKLDVPEGFEFWIRGLNTQGESEYGVLEPINSKEHLVLWNRLYRGTKGDFIREVRKFSSNRLSTVEQSSQIYQVMVERKIAAAQERENQQESLRQKRAAERKRIKDLYLQKVFDR